MPRKTITFIACIVFISIPLALLDYAHFPYSDGAEHGAAVRELAMNPINPGDPLLANHPGNSPRFVPSIFLMALFMRLLQLDVLVTIKIFLIIYFILFLVSVAIFSREYFNDSGQVPWTLASLLFLWGLGWMGSSAYMFSAILFTAYFPSVVSFSLSLIALSAQLRFLRCKKNGFLIAAVMGGALAFVNHPLTGVFFFVCSGLLYIEKRGFEKRVFFYYLLSVVAAFSLMALWPYYEFFSNFFKVSSGEMARTLDYQLARQYHYSNPILRSGPALVGIPFLILFWVSKRYLLLVGGFVVFSLIYLSGYFFGVGLANHFIFFVIFTLQMAFSRIIREWFSLSIPSIKKGDVKKITAWFLVVSLGIGVIIQAKLTGLEFLQPAFYMERGSFFPHYSNPNKTQLGLRKYLREGDVVLSDLYSSWSIPVYTGAKIIALYHTSPHVSDNLERIKALEIFYHSSTTSEERRYILKKYSVTHIYLNFCIAGKDLESTLKEMGFSVIAHTELFSVLSVFNQLLCG